MKREDNNLFFGDHGDELTFESESDFIKKLSYINDSVPRRTEGRISKHRERYCLKIYLKSLYKEKLLRFPMGIKKGESPDFLIITNNETIALEVTEATTENFQIALTESEKRPAKEETMIEILPLFNKDKKVQQEEIKKALRKKEEKLTGKGWDGDSPEKEWVTIILEAVIKKNKKLNELHFKNDADKYELIIYDNSHVRLLIHLDKALSLLTKNFQQADLEKIFDVIWLITKNEQSPAKDEQLIKLYEKKCAPF